MMGNLYSKGASLILQIIFVVVLVLVFAWFDPFDLLSPSKLKLKDTPVQVESIKSIGQLISAEYYGEVISSLQEVINEKDYDSLQQFNTIVNDLHKDFKLAIDEFSKNKISGGDTKIYQAFQNTYPDIVSNPMFDTYLYYIHEKIKNNNYRRAEVDKSLTNRIKTRLIKRLYKNNLHWRDKLFNIQTDEFKEIKKESVRKKSKSDFRHSRLVLIGRGWVKAGFDFKNFSNRNFRYDSKYHRIHFIGLEPQILSATINPWFIPEQGVEGFEFLIAERGTRLKPEYTNIVKQRCLDKLQQQALEKQILLQAKQNAEHNLRSFFSLLLDEDIKGVYFHTNYLTYMLNVILQDSVISNEELCTIDTAISFYYSKYNDEDKIQNIANFIDSLKKYKTKIYNVDIHLNNYSSLLFTMLKDRMIDSADIVRFDKHLVCNELDTLWYSKIFNSAYFSRSDDSLTQSQRQQTDSIWRKACFAARADFCKDLKKLVKSFCAEPDTIFTIPCQKME